MTGPSETAPRLAAPSAAQLIATADPTALSDPERPVRFRRTFTIDAPPASGELLITACGIYRAFLNGTRVGDHVLAPGWQTYHHRHFLQSFDVAALIVPGENVLAVEVAEGWYRGTLGFLGGRRENYGSEIGPVVELRLPSATIGADNLWRSSPSAVLRASLYGGETYDQRFDDDWTEPGYDDSGWSAVRLLDFDAGVLVPQPCPPVRRVEEVAAVSISPSPAGKTLVDFGQNLVGWLRVRVPDTADATITLRHAEVLEDGELGTRPLRGAAATDVLHTSGRGGNWEPEFTFHGFRYAEVTGWPGELALGDLTAVVVHTDLEPTGTFECSHELLTRLHENARWGAKGNFVSVPTDCPQRDERLGWTGDIQVFAPAAAFLFDCNTMLRSWLGDLAAEQSENDGVVPMVIPNLPKMLGAMPFAGWGDAAIVVPWVLYERFGDKQVLEDQYASMCAWVDAIAERSAPDGLWRQWQFGDWLDPAAPPDKPAQGRTDMNLAGGAYQVRVVRMLARIAEIIGRPDDANAYEMRAAKLAEAFRNEFVTPNGRLVSDSPTAFAMAICFDLLEPEQIEAAHRRLRRLVEKDDFHIGTGFLGTPIICDALVAAGAPDHAFRLLMQRECPSWLYSVTMGATTIWERYDSMLPDGSINPGAMTSFNHYALGAVVDFVHRRVAGLAPGAPGYAVIDIAPLVGGGLTWARASHRTPFGEASVAWERDGGQFTLEVTIPDGSTGRVWMPDGSELVEVGPGSHRFGCAARPATDDPV